MCRAMLTHLEHCKSPRGHKVGLTFFLNDDLVPEAGSLLSSSILLRRREVCMQTRQQNKFPVSPFKHASLSGSWL